MSRLTSERAIVLADEHLAEKDLRFIAYSNGAFVRALLAEFLTEAEIFRDAVLCSYVDRYLGEIDNGGLSQFFYNCRGEPETIEKVPEGLRLIGAVRHAAVYERACRHLESIGSDRLSGFLGGDYFGENRERDELDRLHGEYEEANTTEDLTLWTAAYLLEHDSLVILALSEFEAEARRRGEAMPDREARVARARNAEPRFLKIIQALCDEAGLTMETFDGGDATHHHEGHATTAWRFLTDGGWYHMIDLGGQALLFPGRPERQPTGRPVPSLTIDAPVAVFGDDPYAQSG